MQWMGPASKVLMVKDKAGASAVKLRAKTNASSAKRAYLSSVRNRNVDANNNQATHAAESEAAAIFWQRNIQASVRRHTGPVRTAWETGVTA